MNIKQISFLFGSGISKPAAFPMTSDITSKILSGEDIVYKWTNYCIEPMNTNSFYKERVNRAVRFVNAIKDEFKDHYSFSGREMNYEDIFNLLDSIHSEEWGTFENPIISKNYTDQFQKEYPALFESWCSLPGEIDSMIEVTSYAQDYIADIVEAMLDKPPMDYKHLEFLNILNEEPDYERINIFTLNHDLLLESYLSQEKLPFSDGFDVNKKWVGIYNRKFRLLKLHGSIGWYYHAGNDDYEDFISKAYYRDNLRPMLLIGSLNKLVAYNRGLYFKLHVLFYQYLKNSKYLIISGYGFSDQGINSRIIDWLFSSRENRIILIHKDINYVKKSARNYIKWNIDRYVEMGIMKVIPKFIQDTSWDEIKEYL
jgi:hypothetical protein